MGKKSKLLCKGNCARIGYCSKQYKNGCNNKEWKEIKKRSFKELIEMVIYDKKK